MAAIPKNQIRTRNSIEQHEHEDSASARRSLIVDEQGSAIDTQNPLPVVLTDGSINIDTVNAQIAVALSHLSGYPDAGDEADSVQIGDGVDILDINPDGSINVVTAGLQELDIQNILIPNKNTEESIAIPNGTRRLEFQARGNSKIQWTFQSGDSNTNFITLNPGNIEVINMVKLDSKTLYLQTSKDNEVVEVRAWTLT